MRIVCAHCGKKIGQPSIEITVKLRGLTYTTNVLGQTCLDCRKTKVDPSEHLAYKVSIAMRLVQRGRLAGREHAFCRRAIQVSLTEHAKYLGVSEECLDSLESSGSTVAHPVYEAMAKRVRHRFSTLAFVPRFPLDEEPRSSKFMDG
jgi:hypothetical protein